MGSSVQVRHEAETLHLRLSAPHNGNALNQTMLEELREALTKSECDSAVRVICLTAEGVDFCRGLDLGSVCATAGISEEAFQLFQECLWRIRRSNRPVIACVQGPACGGGVGLAAACDLVIAAPQATFMLSEVLLGLIPALIAPFLLERISLARVRYLALSTRAISAEEARLFGLVDQVSETTLHAALQSQLRRLHCASPAALAECKRYLACLAVEQHQADEHLLTRSQMAQDTARSWFQRPEVRRDLQIFAEGGCPEWFGRKRGAQHVQA